MFSWLGQHGWCHCLSFSVAAVQGTRGCVCSPVAAHTPRTFSMVSGDALARRAHARKFAKLIHALAASVSNRKARSRGAVRPDRRPCPQEQLHASTCLRLKSPFHHQGWCPVAFAAFFARPKVRWKVSRITAPSLAQVSRAAVIWALANCIEALCAFERTLHRLRWPVVLAQAIRQETRGLRPPTEEPVPAAVTGKAPPRLASISSPFSRGLCAIKLERERASVRQPGDRLRRR